jgi:hypothetical protein
MKTCVLVSAFVCAITQAAALAVPASAQPYVNQAQVPPNESPKAYCSRLTSFYDWYGASRSENTDGARNMTRITAGIECARGDYVAGIATRENLLRAKGFVPPPEPAALAQAQQFGGNPLPGPVRAEQ